MYQYINVTHWVHVAYLYIYGFKDDHSVLDKPVHVFAPRARTQECLLQALIHKI